MFVITHYGSLFLDNARYDIVDELKHNNINYYCTRIHETLDTIKYSTESDVVVQLLPEAPPAVLSFEIANDSTIWINEAIAAYYHKNSVRVE